MQQNMTLCLNVNDHYLNSVRLGQAASRRTRSQRSSSGQMSLETPAYYSSVSLQTGR